MPTILTIAVDQYSDQGDLISSHLAARASNVIVEAFEVFHDVTVALPATWRQMTYNELVDHFAATRPADHTVWEQLSLF